MSDNAKLERFFNAADDLITGKFILSDTKIGELLRSVAASEELTALFSAATEGYNFQAAKAAYLRDPVQGRRGEAFLPNDRGEVLAFVFCLLAEIDAGKIRFGDFLLRYFYEDGSYTASYERFVNKMIRPFRDIVRDCFPASASAPAQTGRAEARKTREESAAERLDECIARERERIAARGLSEEDAIAAERILGETQVVLGRGEFDTVKALLCGYLYFLQVTDSAGENSDLLFSIAEEL